MKTIISILMLLVATTVMAHNKVVVVPMFDEPECLITGGGIECDKKPTARIPIDKTVICGTLLVHNIIINYTEIGKKVIFEISQTPKEPYIVISFRSDIMSGPFGDEVDISLTSIVVKPGGSSYSMWGGSSMDFCSAPGLIDKRSNFSAAGNEWRMTPIFSSNAPNITLEELIFERQ